MLSPAPSDSLANTLVSIDHAEAQGDRSHLSDDQIATLDRGTQRLMAGDSTAVRAVESVLSWTVRMPVYRWEQARHEVDKLARKATKKGVAAPKIEEVAREVIGEGDEAETWIVARLLGAAPVLNGWSCVATLTPGKSSETPVMHTATGESSTRLLDAGKLSDISMRCDHVIPCKRGSTTFTRKCGTRKRALVFVIEHDDHGIKCVGSKCLNDYLGSDALTAWFVFSRFHALGAQVDGDSWDRSLHAQWLADHPEHACTSSGRADVPVAVRDFVACVSAHVRAHGYLRSREAYEQGTEATGRAVWDTYQTAEHVAPTEDDFARADEIGAWIETIDANETDAQGRESYRASLAFAVRSSVEDGVHRSAANLIASAVPSFARELKRRAEQSEAAGVELVNEYLPFERDTPITARLRVVRVMHWALSCVDSSGRTVIVRKRSYTNGGEAVARGDELVVTGKIGDASEYNGTRQTFVNAPKVYRPEECAVV